MILPNDTAERFIARINREPAATGPAVPIRNAATLVLVRGTGKSAQVLMGRRHGGHKFMPNMVVFPGGRVDRCDARLVGWAGDLPPQTLSLLSGGIAARTTAARALGLAAVRETFEETGFIVGARGKLRTRSPAWKVFAKTGYKPNLAHLHYFARATTPPGRPRRFDTRFFIMNADHLARANVAPATDELSGVEWLSF
ncbi:MAG: NUDIX hydrolase, partial [Alphaproteobacteria bacterium]